MSKNSDNCRNYRTRWILTHYKCMYAQVHTCIHNVQITVGLHCQFPHKYRSQAVGNYGKTAKQLLCLNCSKLSQKSSKSNTHHVTIYTTLSISKNAAKPYYRGLTYWPIRFRSYLYVYVFCTLVLCNGGWKYCIFHTAPISTTTVLYESQSLIVMWLYNTCITSSMLQLAYQIVLDYTIAMHW